MPFASEGDPAWENLQQRIGEALAPFAAEIAARECSHGSWVDCEEDCPYGETRAKPGSMPVIQDFVLVAVTADMGDADGDQEIHAVCRMGQRNHITKGLLHVALHE